MKSLMDVRVCLFLVCMLAREARAYKPVMFMHGILAAGSEADGTFQWIKKAHPGTETYSIAKYEKLDSLVNLMEQVDDIKQDMMSFMDKHPGGIHLICFSQGGLVCRAVLEHIQHNVDTFISLSSPQSGQFGDTVYTKYLFPNLLRDNVYKMAYTRLAQKDISVANYWNDPHQQPLYRNMSEFLAVINNDTYNARSQEFKSNFVRLKKLVMIGGPDDGVITPWQSSHFGTYDKNLAIVEMKDTQWYTRDMFGLKTLDARGALTTHVVPGVHHRHWHTNNTVFQNYILPYLT